MRTDSGCTINSTGTTGPLRMAAAGLVQVARICKRYGQQLAVDGVSFSIAPGEIVGFVGPNGAGKSTTLRILTGLITADSGSVSLDGIDQRTDPTGFRARLGVLIEAPAIYPMLNAYEHLAYVARLRRAFDRTRIETALRDVGLDPRSAKHVGKFSLGMKQRLGIAMAIFAGPSLLVLDEPMNGLDPSGIAELRDFLRTLPERHGTSVLMSSHLLSEIEQTCHRVLFIREGRLVGETTLSADSNDAFQTLWLRTGDDRRAVAVLQAAPFILEAENDVVGVSCRVAAADVARIAPLLVREAIEILELTPRGRRLEETYLARYAAEPAKTLG
jgi:ABC-type multidrug transport system ATPase subunit